MAVSDIIIAPATIYYAPTGEPLPSMDTIDFGEAWGGNWINMGYTLTPISLEYKQDLFTLMVEQVTLPIKRLRMSEEVTIETSLAEINTTNLNVVLDGTVTTVAAGSSIRAKEYLQAGGKTSLLERAWGFEGLLKLDGASSNIPLPIRVFLYKGNASINGKMEFAKKNAVGIPLHIQALGDSSKAAGKQLIEIQRVTGKATTES